MITSTLSCLDARGPIRGGRSSVPPPSPNYMPRLEEPEQAPPSPDYVPGPEHADDEIVAEDQPYVEDASPTAQSPDYVPESDPEVDPEEDDDEDFEEDHVDYPADGGDCWSRYTPALADSVVVALPAADQAPSIEETEPFKTDESAATPPPHPRLPDCLALSTPPSSPAILMVFTLPHDLLFSTTTPLPSPSLPLSPPSLVLSPSPPPSPIRSLGYRAAMIRAYHTPLPISGSLLPITTIVLPLCCRRVTGPEERAHLAAAARPVGGLRADYGLVATMDREMRRDPKREVRYGITDSWDEIVETLQGAPVSTDTELGRHMTAFETRVRQDTDEIYTRLDDEQSQRQLLAGRLNMLFRDRRAHAYTRHLMVEIEQNERVVDSGRTPDSNKLYTDIDQCVAVIQATRVTTLQGHVTALQGQVTALQGQQGPVGGPAQPELPEEADNDFDQGVTAALAARDANRNGDDSHTSGTGGRRTERVARECIYQDFMKCKPLYFKGTEGVVELTQWFERMEIVFRISNCSVENQINFSTCTLLAGALTWWNSHVMTASHDVAYACLGLRSV
ncbi:hypothetical protein Tco_0216016 [Tanacetum coccineum]